MSIKRRQCWNNPDAFCYICGDYMRAKCRFNVRDFTKRAYEAYFGMKLRDQDKPWAPHKVCKHCTETLRFWTQGKVNSMRFGVHMVWHEPKNHHDDCYFCIVNMSGWNQRKKKDWYYPDIESARRPIPHCAEVPVPAFTSLPALTAADEMLEAMDDTDRGDSSISSSSSMGGVESSHSSKPKPFSQGQLNDLIRDLGLSKKSSEILASRLDEHAILGSETKITFYRNRDDMLIRFFLLWKITLFIVTTSKAFFQKWVFQSTIQMIGDCLSTAPNVVWNVCYFTMVTCLHVFRSDILWFLRNTIKMWRCVWKNCVTVRTGPFV